MRRSLRLALLAGLALAAGASMQAGLWARPAVVPLTAAHKLSFEENPGGLQCGFWTNYSHTADVLRDFGPRPIERVNFHTWAQRENTPGHYTWDDAFQWEQWGHLSGSTVITNVNLFFTRQLNPQGMQAMPGHVAPDITDPATRAAARRFLAAFVEKLLAETGSAWLVLDYEMLWFALPIRPEIRTAYRDWFVEAAALCRETAASRGAADRLKIGLIVNTDPFGTAGHSLGNPALPHHTPERWLLDCVAAADFLGIDTYAGGHAGSVTPDQQLAVIKFWIQHYAGDRPVFVTESGFTTSRDHGDASEGGYHIRGTEAQQAAFFETMFAALTAKNADPLLQRLRGYAIWCYLDRPGEHAAVEAHFGLRRGDRSPKPAFAVVAAALARIDADPALSPTRLARRVEVLGDLTAARPVALQRNDGTNYDALALEFTVPAGRAAPLTLEVETTGPVVLLGRVNDLPWLTTHPDAARRHRVALPALPPGTTARLQLQFTAARYPLRTELRSLRIVAPR